MQSCYVLMVCRNGKIKKNGKKRKKKKKKEEKKRKKERKKNQEAFKERRHFHVCDLWPCCYDFELKKSPLGHILQTVGCKMGIFSMDISFGL